MPSPDWLFQTSNTIALLGWIILIFFPRRWRIVWIPHFVIPTILAFLYAPLAMTGFGEGGGNFSSIEGVRTLFQNDESLLAGWVHYLAFDLFLGSWIAVQSDKIGTPRTVQAVILVATFMLGPIGLLLFILMRSFSAGLVDRDPGRVAGRADSDATNIGGRS